MENINNSLLIIIAGMGGQDVNDICLHLFKLYSRYFNKNNIKNELDINNLTIKFDSKYFEVFKFNEEGIFKIIRLSPTTKKRQTSLVYIKIINIPKLNIDKDTILNKNNIEIETFRSSGSGGQHINKTDSAVRIKHNIFNIQVTCQEYRNQVQNKEQALERLYLKIKNLMKDGISKEYKDSMYIEWSNKFRRIINLYPNLYMKDYILNIKTNNFSDLNDISLLNHINILNI